MNLRTGAVVAAFLLLASCTQGNQGIFASIEREQKVKSSGGLSEVATVSHMAVLSSSYYIAGGGALFHRSITQNKWHPSSINYNGKEYNRFVAVGSVGVAGTPTKLYAVANTDSTDTNALFSSTDGSTWTIDTTIAADNVRAAGLVPIVQTDGFTADELLLTTVESSGSDPGAYERVYIVSDSAISPAITLPLAFSFPITGAAVDSGNYYFINNDGPYYYNGGATASRLTGISGNGYYGILLLAGGTLTGVGNGTDTQAVLSSSKGKLYWGTVAAGAWTSSGEQSNVEESGSGRKILMGSMIYQDQNATKYVWIGTRNGGINEGNGFASLSAALGFDIQPPKGTGRDNYNSTILPTSQVLTFFRAPLADGNSYYAGTAAHGLWKWKSGSWSQQ